MNKAKLLKLAKMLKLMSELNTDKGILIADNEIAVGIEVFISDEEGNLIPANDGDYETEDSVVTVEGGKVVSIKIKEPEQPVTDEPAVEENAEEEPIDEPVDEPDEKDARIAELEVEIEALNLRIAELESENKELKEKLEEPAAEAIEDQKDFRMNREQRRRNTLETLQKLNQK